jgi:acetyl-CoA carboxylase biotin carboxylase subunit
MFRRILVANRGEIALRIIRTCREMGIETISIYSDPDANALHIVHSERSVRLDGDTLADTYLNVAQIIDIAKRNGADALHPGYGFLSENPELAAACAGSGIAFIGPSPQAILDLGNKVKAKEIAKSIGAPLVPGTDGPVLSEEHALEFARGAGLPLILKASAGGGGRGMRVVRKLEDLPKLLASAKNEAKSAFANDEVFIERYIEGPKHIEFQILADHHGNVVHLGERDCSIQRRHQKLIEEAPSPALTPELRERMGQVAVDLARAANYTNAGTVEFLLDKNGEFYFMEMNTRLQVEHPVTEMVTFIDLVRQQIRVAAGEPLDFTQADIQLRGWSFEVRINAEDPLRQFMPALGRLNRFIPPAGSGVRLDSCAYEGYDIPTQYDSMVGKLITYGRSRQQAIEKMRRALDEFIITGVRTTIPFHRYVFDHPDFVSGNFDTGFIEKHFSDEQVTAQMRSPDEVENIEHIAMAAALHYYLQKENVLESNQAVDREAGRRWSVVHRLGSTSYLPR